MRRLTNIKAVRLVDPTADEVRQNHAACIAELQGMPAATAEIISNVELADGVTTYIPHGLGRAPRMVIVSPIFVGSSTSGRFVEDRDGVDRTKAIKLTSIGFGSAVTVDLEVK